MRKAPEARHAMRRYALYFILIAITSVAFAGCGPTSGTGSHPQASKGEEQGQTLPAVTEPTQTPSPPTATTGTLPPNSPADNMGAPTPTTPESQAAAGPGAWTQHSRAGADGARLSYRYPPTWTEDLTYCPGDKNTNQGLGSHLPPGCASTDFLFGQKVAGVAPSIKPSQSKTRSAGDMRVVTQVDTPIDTNKAASTYTVLVYDASGTPVSGFVTYIGPGTSEADTKAILATLDDLASTVTVEK
ncbi:MAG: hypothetical protein M3441_18690 [Chloroflexota bacterium]|nr:hypothetical protein [Chloroflexota bacterium]